MNSEISHSLLAIEKLFPLPLTPFETYMVIDDKPDYPSSTSAQYVFRGEISNREKFTRAFFKAAESQPSFYVRLAKKGNKYFWTADVSTPLPLIYETSEKDFTQETTGETPFDSFDITQRPGVFFRVIEGVNSVLIDFRIHHSLSDGVGMNQFIAAWIDYYSQSLDPQPGWQEPLYNIVQYSTRDNLFQNPDKRAFSERFHAIKSNVGNFFAKKPWEIQNLKDSPYCPPVSEPPQEKGIRLPSASWFLLTQDKQAQYHAAAKRLNVSMNTLLIRDLFLTIKRWSDASGKEIKKNELIRVLMPRNLRNEHHVFLPCTNVVGYTFMDCLPEKCNLSAEFLDYIDGKTRRNDNTTLFIKALKYFLYLPWLFRKITSRKCLSSAVISNVGNIIRSVPQKRFIEQNALFAPGLRLHSIHISPLCRPGTPVTAGISVVENNTVIAFTLDRMHFNSESSSAFIELFFDQMEQSIK